MSAILKKFIGLNQVDETIIRLSNNASLRARNAANSADINLLFLNTSNVLQLAVAMNAGGFVLSNLGAPTNPNDASTKTYTDTAISTGTATNISATSNSTLTTLPALTSASSLATVGTITSGVWSGTTIAIAHGGTGQTSAAAAYNALSPMTTAGDLEYELTAGVAARLPIGSNGQVLTVVSGLPAWSSAAASANQALSNLASTAVNVSIVPGADNSIDLGSGSDRWGSLYAVNVRTASITAGAVGMNLDSDVGIQILGSANTNSGTLQIFQASVNGSNFISFTVDPALATTTAYTLPADGTNGQVLSTDGAGVLSWVTQSGGANTALSNLTTTSINSDLLPDSDLGRNLGSSSLRWSQANINQIFALAIYDASGSTNVAQQGLDIQLTGSTTAGHEAAVINMDALSLKGNGSFAYSTSLRFFDSVITPTNYVGFKAPATLAGITDYILPATDGTPGQFLSTDSAGNLSWQSASASGANTALSNLASVAINTSLLPASDNTIDLGSSSKTWANAFMQSIFTTGISTKIIDVANQQLRDSANAIQFSWSTSGVTIQNALSMNSQKITNVANGTATNDAVNFGQLENALAGINFRPAVALYDNVDTTKPATTATLIDGVTVTNGMRVLFVNLSSGNNEVYTAALSGINITWTAALDNDRVTAAPSTGDSILVLQGTTFALSQWSYNGTSFVQTNGANQIAPGNALSKTGNVLDVKYDNSTIALNGSNQLFIPTSGVNTTQLAPASVTLAKMANLAANSIIGNNTGSPATPIALTQTQVTAMINLFSSSLSGAVSASGGGTVNFLRADGTWAPTPSSPVSKKDLFVLSSTDITHQYVDLSFVAQTDSIDFVVQGSGSQIEGSSYDYTVNYTGGAGGVTRVTFVNGLATGGANALVAADVVVLKYLH